MLQSWRCFRDRIYEQGPKYISERQEMSTHTWERMLPTKKEDKFGLSITKRYNRTNSHTTPGLLSTKPCEQRTENQNWIKKIRIKRTISDVQSLSNVEKKRMSLLKLISKSITVHYLWILYIFSHPNVREHSTVSIMLLSNLGSLILLTSLRRGCDTIACSICQFHLQLHLPLCDWQLFESIWRLVPCSGLLCDHLLGCDQPVR